MQPCGLFNVRAPERAAAMRGKKTTTLAVRFVLLAGRIWASGPRTEGREKQASREKEENPAHAPNSNKKI